MTAKAKAEARSARGLWAEVKALKAEVAELRELAITIRAYGRLGLIVFPVLTSTISGLVVWLLTRPR